MEKIRYRAPAGAQGREPATPDEVSTLLRCTKLSDGLPSCAMGVRGSFLCCRIEGHEGPHIACGLKGILCVWEEVPDTVYRVSDAEKGGSFCYLGRFAGEELAQIDKSLASYLKAHSDAIDITVSSTDGRSLVIRRERNEREDAL